MKLLCRLMEYITIIGFLCREDPLQPVTQRGYVVAENVAPKTGHRA